VKRRLLAAALVLAVGLVASVAAAAPVDVTGTWSPKYWTLKISLRQQGERRAASVKARAQPSPWPATKAKTERR
jgi:hypothetical protein